MNARQLFSIMEGQVSTLGGNSVPYAQAMTVWLRAMKENINLAARFVENDFVFYVTTGLTEAESAVSADGDTWVYGAMIKSTEDVAHVVGGFDALDATAYVPGTTAEGATITRAFSFLAPAAASTSAPVVMGQVWTPYLFFDKGFQAFSVDYSDGATGSTAARVNLYSYHRNQ